MPSPTPEKLAIYGAGGLGREIAWMLQDMQKQEKRWDIIGFFDDGKTRDSAIDGLPVLGGLKEINAAGFSLNLVIAISAPRVKEKLVDAISNTRIHFPVIIHPSCQPGDPKYNRFGRGTLLTAGVILTTGIQTGDFTLINLSSTIGHDVQTGAYCSIMPGCSISGAVTLGDRCFVGTGARLLQNITIGADSTIGAGAVVTKNVEAKSIMMGVPAIKTN